MLDVARWEEQGGRGLAVCATTAWNGLGFTPHQIWAFRRAEIAAHGETPFRLPEGQKATQLHIRTLPPRAQGVERMIPLLRALLAPHLARLEALGRKPRVAVALGLAERFAEGMGGTVAAERRLIEAEVAGLAKAAGIEPAVLTVPRGHASAAFAAITLGRALAAGSLDAAVLGGLDSYFDADVIDRLAAEKRLFDGHHLETFIPGEGGAFLLLARREVARRCRWPVHALLEAAATDQEPAALDGELPIAADALSRTLRAICDPLEAERRGVDIWFSDLTHERWRVQEWQLALPRASVGVSPGEPALELLVPFLGDLGAATLPTAAALAVEGFTRGDPPGGTCLACASSAGPDRGALLMTEGDK